MQKQLAAAMVAGLWFFSGCQDQSPQTTATTPATKPSVAVMPTTQPTAAADPWDVLIAGKPVYFKVRAEGVQIYEPKEVGGKWVWALKAPEALLYNDKGRNVGKHYGSPAGPTWEMVDGSKIVGEKKGALEKPGTIPWLAIAITDHDGPKGKLTPIGFVERVDTDGGVPPASAPTPAQVGKEERVGYRATYLFYAGK